MSYSIENANRFRWSSVSGDLSPDRVQHLERFVIGPKVLDAGCGGGAYTHFLSEQDFQVTGIDFHLDFLEVAKNKDLRGTFIQADILSLPFDDDQFDTSFSFDVLEHVDDIKAIKELARVTAQRIIIAVPQKDNHFQQFGLTFSTYQDPTHLRYYDEESLLELCNIVNYRKVEIIKECFISGYAIAEYLMEPLPPFTLKNIKVGFLWSYLARKFMWKSTFKKINSGLVAVIDL